MKLLLTLFALFLLLGCSQASTTITVTETETTTATTTATVTKVIHDCHAEIYDHAEFPSAAPGTTAEGPCLPGYFSPIGAASRDCSSEGVWSSKITDRCLTIRCPPEVSSDGISWPSTIYRKQATGLCPAGSSGEPKRRCLVDGSWADESTINPPCVPDV